MRITKKTTSNKVSATTSNSAGFSRYSRIEELNSLIQETEEEIKFIKERLLSYVTEKFLLEQYPYKDGDSVSVDFNGTIVEGVLSYDPVKSPNFFHLYPRKKDGGLSSKHRVLISNPILGYTKGGK